MKIYNLPLIGKIIIESSAGTGKTYIIELIYLRLLLGIKKKKLKIQEILILTYDKKNIDKLKLNILKKIKKMKKACVNNGIELPEKSIYKKFLHLIKNKKKAINSLAQAEKNIHESSIYTINDFCKLIIKKNKFKLNFLNKKSIITNEIKLQKKACEEFWKKNYYPMDYSMSKIIFNEWKTPKQLFKQIKNFLTIETPIFIKKNKTNNIKYKHKKLINKIKKIKKMWIIYYKKIEKLILYSDINRHIYNKRNLKNWFNKITKWANSHTIDYKIPNELNYFSQNKLTNKTKKGIPPKSIFFSKIEKFLKKKFTIKDLLISQSIVGIKNIIDKIKKEEKKINSEELLKILNNIIKKNTEKKKIIYSIFNQYKVTIIDEYQEIKKQQNKIFQKIYKKKNCLILLGDLKQTIDTSNNKNIFNHIKTKKKIKKHYTIQKNWRSSCGITESINKLFSQKKNPFLLKQIQFIPLKYNKNKKHIGLIHKKKTIPPINLYIYKKNVSYFEYKEKIANQCAKKIYDWITYGKKKKTWLFNKNKKKFIEASDITILIRNEEEALTIKKSLEKFNINSNFIYNKQNFLNTNEITEILLILKAIIEPKNENSIYSALATSLIGFTSKKIHILQKNKKQIIKKIEKFNKYLLTWNKFGILAALRRIIIEEKIDYNLLLDQNNGKKKLINLIYISELLQKKEKDLTSKKNLINWLNNKIYKKKNIFKKIQKKYENNQNAVNISTIYQSKGLSHPIVWIPFDSYITKDNIKTFHNRKNFKLYLDFTENEKNKQLAEEEYLSQKIRLLYVSITRSIYHCSIGITPSIKKKKKNSIFHQSTLMLLLKKEKKNSYEKNLKTIQDKNISVKKIKNIKITTLKTNKKIKFLIKKNINFKIKKTWKITNYTNLIKNKYCSQYNKFTENKKINKKNKKKEKTNYIFHLKNKKNIHNFPSGTKSGIFLHSILKKINFKKIPNKKWIAKELKNFNFSPDWSSIIQKCLINVLNVPLINKNLKLSTIKSNKKIKEMKFYIPINKKLHSSKLEKIMKKYDILYKKIEFQSFKGILNGSIDLIFYWKKKIYLIDYKSNLLGKKITDYNQQSLKSIIIKKKYNFQYIIYTLATHRFFKNKIKNYNYKENFGGIFYLFLRGCDINKLNYGIYHEIPSYSLIKNLDKIF